MAIKSIVSLSNVFWNQRMEAEYYRPDVLKYLKKKVNWGKIGAYLDFIQYGTSLPLNEEEIGYKIFRLNEIEDCFLTKPEKWVAIPENKYNSLRLKKDDILFCRTNGNIKYVGRTGILKEDVDAAFASYLVRARTKQKYVLPEYLTIYLTSNIGRAFVERQAMHSNQFNVSAEQLRKIPIPLLDMDLQNHVKKLVEDAASLRKKSNSTYLQAEALLLEELGLATFKQRYELSYSVNLSKAFGCHRVDAEHFQPAYEKILKMIQKYPKGYDKLIKYADNIKPDYDPTKFPDRTFQYVELADIDLYIGIIRSSSEIKGNEAPSRARRILNKDDVIVSSVEGSLEKVALVDKEYEGALASTGFFQFRCKKMLPEVLLALSRSVIIQSQLKKECSGTILSAVPNESIRRILIPNIPDKTQERIAKLIRDSHATREKCRGLLEEARRKVEQEVEMKN